MSSRFSVMALMLSRPSVFLFDPPRVRAWMRAMEESSGRSYRLVGCLRSTEALDGVKLVSVSRS